MVKLEAEEGEPSLRSTVRAVGFVMSHTGEHLVPVLLVWPRGTGVVKAKPCWFIIHPAKAVSD
jgi:hypothetical protein